MGLDLFAFIVFINLAVFGLDASRVFETTVPVQAQNSSVVDTLYGFVLFFILILISKFSKGNILPPRRCCFQYVDGFYHLN